MGQEYDRDKPPDSVLAGVFTQGWYRFQADRKLTDMGLYVRLVAAHVKPVDRFDLGLLIKSLRKAVQGIRKP